MGRTGILGRLLTTESCYAISRVVMYGNSMGGIDYLLALDENGIPVTAWIETVASASIMPPHASFPATLKPPTALAQTARIMQPKTAGQDPMLLAPTAFPRRSSVGSSGYGRHSTSTFAALGRSVQPLKYAQRSRTVERFSNDAVDTSGPARILLIDVPITGGPWLHAEEVSEPGPTASGGLLKSW